MKRAYSISSNMPTQLRRAVEEAVTKGHVDYLVCTSTLLQGVNTSGTQHLHVPTGARKVSPAGLRRDFWNLSGRAGRLRREFQGNIFLI